jgi:hypothetical protein
MTLFTFSSVFPQGVPGGISVGQLFDVELTLSECQGAATGNFSLKQKN